MRRRWTSRRRRSRRGSRAAVSLAPLLSHHRPLVPSLSRAVTDIHLLRLCVPLVCAALDSVFFVGFSSHRRHPCSRRSHPEPAASGFQLYQHDVRIRRRRTSRDPTRGRKSTRRRKAGERRRGERLISMSSSSMSRFLALVGCKTAPPACMRDLERQGRSIALMRGSVRQLILRPARVDDQAPGNVVAISRSIALSSFLFNPNLSLLSSGAPSPVLPDPHPASWSRSRSPPRSAWCCCSARSPLRVSGLFQPSIYTLPAYLAALAQQTCLAHAFDVSSLPRS